MADVEKVWRLLDEKVRAGRYPGYVAALRIDGVEHVHAGGTTAVEADSPPMTPDTLFRIASLTKPMGGALTLSLVQDGVLTLDDPIARWLPELAHPRVLVARDAALSETVPADRPVTVRHLLTCTSGWGVAMEETPRQTAMFAGGAGPGPLPPQLTPDEFVAAFAQLPLAFQPGDGWIYDSGIDLLGVLLARATGEPLHELLAERVTGPLGMVDTGFWAVDVGRLATAYTPNDRGLDVLDPQAGVYAKPPAFEKLSGGLVSSVVDVLRFFTAMADGGAPVLTPSSLALMTSDQLTPGQRAMAEPFTDAGRSWGLGTGVDVEPLQPWLRPGRWGWTGGTGTTADADPATGTVAVLLTQRAMTGPQDTFTDFWAAVAHLTP